MKRPARVASQLSESLHRQLNTYALTATAAGVGALALAHPADAKIIYTPAHVVIGENHKIVAFDLNHDGIMDFGLFYVHAHRGSDNHQSILIAGYPNGSNSNVVAITGRAANGDGIAAALTKGSKIPGTNSVFRAGALAGKSSSDYVGNWFPNVKDRYLGMTVVVKGQKHYGWARMSVRTTQHPFTVTGTLTGYAYETIAGKSIRAGQTKEANDPVNQDLSPGASLTSPATDNPQPISLGALAAGAPGLSVWRRESVGAEQ